MRVLLVFPPYVSPWVSYLSLPVLSAHLKETGLAEVTARDLNIEFFDHVTSARTRPPRSEAEHSEALHWEEIDEAKAVLRSRARFPAEDAEVQVALNRIDLALQAASRRFGSTRLHLFGTRRRPGAIRRLLFPYGPCLPRCEMAYSPYSSEEVRAAVEDEAQNPFLQFYRDVILPDLADRTPDIVGISVAFPQQHIPAFTLSGLIKRHLPEVHVTMGGAQISKLGPTMKSSRSFQRLLLPLVDSLVLGEGEAALAGLVRAVRDQVDLRQVPNLVFVRGRTLVVTAVAAPLDMAALPSPDFSQIPWGRYLSCGSSPSLPLQATRGCYWGRCAFCDSFLLLGRYRARPVHQLVNDLRSATKGCGVNDVRFSDEALPPGIMLRLSAAVAAGGPPVRWSSYARFERSLTPDFCRRIAAGGCRVLFLGLEAASARVSGLMDKGVHPARALEVLETLRDAGVSTHLFAIIGFPGERRSEAEETFDFLLEHKHLYVSYSCAPFMLEHHSAVARDPARFGVTRLAPDPHHDLATSYPYDVASGLTMEETAVLYEEFNQRLAEAGAYNPIFL